MFGPDQNLSLESFPVEISFSSQNEAVFKNLSHNQQRRGKKTSDNLGHTFLEL